MGPSKGAGARSSVFAHGSFEYPVGSTPVFRGMPAISDIESLIFKPVMLFPGSLVRWVGVGFAWEESGRERGSGAW